MAAIAVNSLPLFEAEAKKSQVEAGGDRKSEEYAKSVSQKIEQPIRNGKKASQQAAEKLGTNSQYVSDAKRIKEESPELFEEIKEGTVTVSVAALVSKLPEQTQQDIIKSIQQGESATQVIKKAVLVTKHKGDEESDTPAEFIESACKVMGVIDLDPGSNDEAQATVKASDYFTIDKFGLIFSKTQSA